VPGSLPPIRLERFAELCFRAVESALQCPCREDRGTHRNARATDGDLMDQPHRLCSAVSHFQARQGPVHELLSTPKSCSGRVLCMQPPSRIPVSQAPRPPHAASSGPATQTPNTAARPVGRPREEDPHLHPRPPEPGIARSPARPVVTIATIARPGGDLATNKCWQCALPAHCSAKRSSRDTTGSAGGRVMKSAPPRPNPTEAA
jgi:hypothetical protein